MNATEITTEELTLLLVDIRPYLNITWVDTALDKKLAGMIKRGITYVNDVGGGEMNYAIEGQARSLLFDYVRYARSHALSDFWEDYRKELTALRSETEVAKYAAETTNI